MIFFDKVLRGQLRAAQPVASTKKDWGLWILAFRWMGGVATHRQPEHESCPHHRSHCPLTDQMAKALVSGINDHELKPRGLSEIDGENRPTGEELNRKPGTIHRRAQQKSTA